MDKSILGFGKKGLDKSGYIGTSKKKKIGITVGNRYIAIRSYGTDSHTAEALLTGDHIFYKPYKP